MKTPKLWALILVFETLLIAQPREERKVKYWTLQRNDIGVTYRVPLKISADTVSSSLQLLQLQSKEKSYFKDRLPKLLKPIVIDHTIESFEGKMTVKPSDSSDRDNHSLPSNCNDVKDRFAQAGDLLEEIDRLVLELERQLEALAEDLPPPDVLAQALEDINEITLAIEQAWLDMENVYPQSLTEQTHYLQYEWPDVMGVSCTPRLHQGIQPTLMELRMPGLQWNQSQGGQVSDFPMIPHNLRVADGSLVLSKLVSIADVCLNDQSIAIIAQAKAQSQPHCQENAVSKFALKVGSSLSNEVVPPVSGRYRSVSCSNLLQDYGNWLRGSSKTYWRGAKFSLNSNKIRTKAAQEKKPSHLHGGYGHGNLSLKGTALVGQTSKYFSDRFSKDRRTPFAKSQADKVSLELGMSGASKVVLNTWGNTSLSLRSMSCFKDLYGDFIRAWIYEGNGVSSVHIGLHKYENLRFLPLPKPVLPIKVLKPLYQGGL
ncbi:hypothetical protein [Pseudobacteriovorax antillogorgiicola]|uniref:Uncharacterized protein n=1 Tax=Pseudobacteriovorax antillogorgiicola TaxID=1513793 RepID=A0A1Y6BSZ8_9BACT|nr:hypothetical protein [Pseudobacteriovorax antillogorgiicola]TCS52960.1 hypothetical protein EDD56_10811 [Pseudobacteriovorax antillogorgiicola]SMF27513.1 hypothetical protein SAMN06296036_108236 [Pseudobacteriovorax antillogorgiicola]